MISRLHRSSWGLIVVPLVVITLLSGCASFSGDEKKSSDFSCKGMPDGATCMDPIEIYERSNDDSGTIGSAAGSGTPTSGSGGKPGTDVPVVVQRNLIVQPANPKPILEEAQVMRVWVAPFIDANQDLQWPGHIFTEVTPRRWTFGERDVARIRTAVPLQVAEGPPEGANMPLPGATQAEYVPGLPPNPTESIPPGPTHMRENAPELERKPYGGGGQFLDYN